MRVRIIGTLNIWKWLDFKEDIKGIMKDFKVEDNQVVWKEFEVEKEIDPVILDKYNLKCEVLE